MFLANIISTTAIVVAIILGIINWIVSEQNITNNYIDSLNTTYSSLDWEDTFVREVINRDVNVAIFYEEAHILENIINQELYRSRVSSVARHTLAAGYFLISHTEYYLGLNLTTEEQRRIHKPPVINWH